MKTKKEVKTFRVSEMCDDCLVDLKYTGMAYLTSPPQYPHECPKCGRQYTLDKIYPTIEYSEVEGRQYALQGGN